MRALFPTALAYFLILTAAVQAGAQEATVKYGAGFAIEQRQGYKVLTVKSPWPGSSSGFTYVLYRRGQPRPSSLKADGFFETPIRKVITFSTTYIPPIVALGEADSIVGVDSGGYVNSPEVRTRIAQGKTLETTKNWAPNLELMISLTPDAVFTYGMGNQWDTHPKMAEAGLPVVICGDWNESDPLARAEWIEFFAAFYDKEDRAIAYFNRTAKEYERLRVLATSAKSRPAVLVNGPFQGTWTVSGGKSYMARLIADSGGAYLWAEDTSTGGLSLSIEAVYQRALKAEVWLNPALSVNSEADVLALDSRFASLPVVASGSVWNDNLRMSPGGGNDSFESAALRPDLVLADLVKIFHPELAADLAFTYYKKIKR